MRFLKYCAFAVLLAVSVNWVLRTQAREEPSSSVGESVQASSSVNVLLLGCDASGVRPDSIMLMHVDGNEGRVTLLSLPRDSKVLYEGRHVKLNTLLALTNDEGKREAIENMTGVSIDYYIKLKVGVFARIVDALGGLRYTVEEDMQYRDRAQGLFINLKAGEQILSGAECEEYCRYREYVMGDLTRTQNQRKLLSELLRQKLKLQYVTKLPAIFSILKEETATDITAGDMATYLPLIRLLAEGEIQIEGLDCPGEYNDMKKEGISFYQIDQKALYKLCQNHF